MPCRTCCATACGLICILVRWILRPCSCLTSFSRLVSSLYCWGRGFSPPSSFRTISNLKSTGLLSHVVKMLNCKMKPGIVLSVAHCLILQRSMVMKKGESCCITCTTFLIQKNSLPVLKNLMWLKSDRSDTLKSVEDTMWSLKRKKWWSLKCIRSRNDFNRIHVWSHKNEWGIQIRIDVSNPTQRWQLSTCCLV